MESFKEWLLQAGKSPKTAASYVKNVTRCIAKDDPASYISTIKSKSHKAFVKSSWRAYCEFQSASKKALSLADKIKFLETIVELTPRKVLSATISSRTVHPLGYIVYPTEFGDLIISEEQEKILSLYSKGTMLVVI